MLGEGGDKGLMSLLVALVMMGLALAMLLGYGRTFINDPSALARAITRWCLRWLVRLTVVCLRHGYRWDDCNRGLAARSARSVPAASVKMPRCKSVFRKFVPKKCSEECSDIGTQV